MTLDKPHYEEKQMIAMKSSAERTLTNGADAVDLFRDAHKEVSKRALELISLQAKLDTLIKTIGSMSLEPDDRHLILSHLHSIAHKLDRTLTEFPKISLAMSADLDDPRLKLTLVITNNR